MLLGMKVLGVFEHLELETSHIALPSLLIQFRFVSDFISFDVNYIDLLMFSLISFALPFRFLMAEGTLTSETGGEMMKKITSSSRWVILHGTCTLVF